MAGQCRDGSKPMKWFLILWAGPIGFLLGWYGLSSYDINFGTFFFSRQMHDLVFQIYGQILGIPPKDIPPLVLKAILLDSCVVVALMALRKRKELRRWWSGRRRPPQSPLGAKRPESLSRAP